MITRRTLLSRAAAVTAATVLGWLGSSPPSIAEDTQSNCDAEMTENCDEKISGFEPFIQLSAVLTGIDGNQLAPGFQGKGVDPAGHAKCEYFKRASKDPNFKDLLSLFDGNGNDPADPEHLKVADRILRDPKVGGLARSIMLAWFLGAWYEPTDVAKYRGQNPKPISFQVVSGEAYTQGWIWRVAEAHPMGYSNLRFGYWNNPPDLKTFALEKFQVARTK
jgi:hypothetical protein